MPQQQRIWFRMCVGVWALALPVSLTGCSSQPSQDEQSQQQGEVIQEHFKQKVDATKPK